MPETLVIENVDLALLELQRIEAWEYILGQRDDTDGIEGILMMLDEWSDKRENKG